jgi:4-amino-4-deoxy-L-arabinose transferase-like glycosyltransferase
VLENEDYAGYFFIQQNLAYFFSGESRHPEPFYYYLPILAGGFFPWSLFLPTVLFRTLRRGFSKMADRTLYLVLWFAAVFLFFSVAKSKLSPYILPVFPALALLTAALWNAFFIESASEGARKGVLYPLGFLWVAASVALVYIVLSPLDKLTLKYGIPPAPMNLLGVAMVIFTGLIFLLYWRRRYKAAFSAVTAMVVVVLHLFIVLIVPYINPYRSTRGLAAELDLLLPEGEKLTFYRRLQDSTLFYTDRKATVLKDLRPLKDHLAAGERVFMVARQRHFEPLARHLPAFFVWDREGDKLLISNAQP